MCSAPGPKKKDMEVVADVIFDSTLQRQRLSEFDLAEKGLTAAQITYWDRTFARIVEDEDWRAELEKNAWGREFKGSAETRKFLEAEHLLLDKILADLGIVKR